MSLHYGHCCFRDGLDGDEMVCGHRAAGFAARVALGQSGDPKATS